VSFPPIGRVMGPKDMVLMRIKPARKHLGVMTRGRGGSISTVESMVNHNADTVFVAVGIDAIFTKPICI